ncbi:MAG TPA: host attachment protein [Zoogloea sp.]|jgi:protein required for attachment to host cells|uniref:host attachment protein n=1 Tax=Zoogloea sp. TaxID=49181 RepID=UPI001B5D4C42|nr:host attachment protein [Zoogloea sp.]MBP8267827.1 host attachment protein [Zoogloea sp.]HOB46104.1 host attachment protein [Zoogloea sp.]HQA08897.1 host attachment protein [Zoogloea sp.]HQE38675.1 host attachment protein [Zoogloea sp.]
MAITWILVANASLARLYANFGPKQGLKLVKELVHPESRMKNSELSSDRAGQIQSNGSGHGAREQQTSPKLNAAKNFAQMLAKELYIGRSRNEFARAILVAPPSFMGMLNATLDAPTAQMVTNRLEKDYTKSTEPDLCGRLETCIFV